MRTPDTRHLIPAGVSIREALKALNDLSGGSMTLFALDPQGGVVGSVTDGDIRRALVEGSELERPVGEIAFRGFLARHPGEDLFELLALARRRRLDLLPEVDSRNRLTGIIDLRRVKSALPIEAVLMAGGKGERLRPLTLDCPKPLLKVGRKAIIDYNVEELLACGVERIYVTVNYLKEQLIEHFSGERFEGRVVCVEEPKRMGTIGSLSLIRELKEENLLLMNSDLLTDLSFEKLYLHHLKSGSEVTLGAVPYNVSIPFSIMRTEGERVLGITEKPTFNYFAGAGVYMMKTALAREIPPGEYMDAPDFVANLIGSGRKVTYFPVEGTWLDIGSPDDFRYANEIMNSKMQSWQTQIS